jgi:hypothetical protein
VQPHPVDTASYPVSARQYTCLPKRQRRQGVFAVSLTSLYAFPSIHTEVFFGKTISKKEFH